MAKSKVISFRLYADDPSEREVLETLDNLQRQGFTPRQIFTDAVLARGGMTPEMFRRRYDTAPQPAIDMVELRALMQDTTASLLSDFLQDIKRLIKSGAISIDDNSAPASGGTMSETESALIMAYKMRQKGGK